MKLTLPRTLYTLLVFIILSCSSDDSKSGSIQTISNAPLEGLLGDEITLVGENLESDKLQVFFDLEEAQIISFSPTEIKVRVPRTLERFDPTLKVINLETNEDILNTQFKLKTPKVTAYSSSTITFSERLTIKGENFDINDDFIEVRINSEKAQILSVSHEEIDVYIPFKILDADLEVEVDAQLQHTTSEIDLRLKNPAMEVLLTDAVRGYNSSIQVTGVNFNPVEEFGEVFIDGLPCLYSSGNEGLNIDVPKGPFNEFSIKTITYKTAGLTTTLDVDIEILTPGIMVDHLEDLYGFDVITYNNKAYAFSADTDTEGYGFRVELHEFTEETEKWRKIEGFGFDGYLNDFAFDNNNSIYLYKGIADNTFELTKFNLDDFTETTIETPFPLSLHNASFFAMNNDLYVLYGSSIENDETTPSEKKYRYRANQNSWEEIDETQFTESIWKSGRISRRIFNNGELYITFSFRGGTSKLDSGLNLTNLLTYNQGYTLFAYEDKVVSRGTNVINDRAYLYNIYTPAQYTEVQFIHSHFGWFFVLSDTIYYHAGFAGNYSTYKLRDDFLNEIL